MVGGSQWNSGKRHAGVPILSEKGKGTTLKQLPMEQSGASNRGKSTEKAKGRQKRMELRREACEGFSFG